MAAPPLLHGRIKYESELDSGFAREVAAISGAEGAPERSQRSPGSGVCRISPLGCAL